MFKEDGNTTMTNTLNTKSTHILDTVKNSTVVNRTNGVNYTVEVENRISGWYNVF